MVFKIANKHTEMPLSVFLYLSRTKGLDIKKRVRQFAARGDVSKHIKRKHLRNLAASTDIACNICDRKFDKVMHLQRHAIGFHSTATGQLPWAINE